MIVKRAQKEEKGNVQFVEERIKRAARLLKGQKDEEGEGDVKESSDDLVPEEEEDDGDDEVGRQDKIDRLLGDLSESRSSGFSNPRLVALRQRRLKLLLGEDSDSSSSDSETSSAVVGNIGKISTAGNPSNQSEPVLHGSNPGPSCGLKVGKPESVNGGEDSGSPSRGAIGCNSRQPESDIRGHSGLSGLDESEAGPSGTNDGSRASREKVKFKKPGSQGGGGRSIRKRSHDED